MTSEPLNNLHRFGLLDQVPFSADLQQGYRTSTSKLGHHQTTLQCLVHTLAVPPETVRILDGLRKQRNLIDYDGELITASLLNECLAQAQALLSLARLNLQSNT